MRRRDLWKVIPGAICLKGLVATPAAASTYDPWKSLVLQQPRSLWLVRKTPRGFDELRPDASQYWNPQEPDVLQSAGYARVCDFLRDRTADKVRSMDARLLDLLVCLQRWGWEYGDSSPIEITSGFRTSAHNERLEGAARASLHTQGKAVDIRHPRVSPTTLSQMGVILGEGGVGFYPGKGFTHVDTGNLRRWGKNAYRPA